MCQITGKVPSHGVSQDGCGPLDNQVFKAPNRFGVSIDVKKKQKPYAVNHKGKAVRPVLLARSMDVLEMGVPQEVLSNGEKAPSNDWHHVMKDREEGQRLMDKELFGMQEARQHYPNVDLLRCPVCGAMVVRE